MSTAPNRDSSSGATGAAEPRTHRVDNSRWPISYHRSAALVRDTDITEMLARIDDAIRRREAHVMVLELDDAIEVSAASRRSLAEQLRAREDSLARYCRGIAVVARTPGARGVHTALRWLAPSPCPERAFESAPEAERWLSSLLT